MNSQPRFGIFSGTFDGDAIWIEAVSGFDSARERMQQLAIQRPGEYFLFSIHGRGIRASIDTSKLVRTETQVNRAA